MAAVTNNANNTIKTRIRLKSDTEANWLKAAPKEDSDGFVPLLGELIVYLADDTHHFSRLKVGNGETNVNYLPFIDAGTINGDSLPSSQVCAYATRNSFPSPGEENVLYIALDTSRIYCFTNSGGYTLLSNFTYTPGTTAVSQITNWSTGTSTRASITAGVLNIKNGQAPSLSYNGKTVINALTKGE